MLRAAPQVPRTANAAVFQGDPLDKLREHWLFEHEIPSAVERKLPLGARLWLIGGLGLAGWAVPAGAAWLFW